MRVCARKKPGLLVRAPNFIWPNMGLRQAWKFLVHRMVRAFGGPARHCPGICGKSLCFLHAFHRLSLYPRGSSGLSTSRQYPCICNRYRGGKSGKFSVYVAGSLQPWGAVLLGRAVKTELLIDLPSNSGGIANEGFLAQVHMLWRIIAPIFLPLVIGGIPIGLVCAVPCY